MEWPKKNRHVVKKRPSGKPGLIGVSNIATQVKAPWRKSAPLGVPFPSHAEIPYSELP